MNDIVVRTENLSKLYRIGQIVGYKTLRESLTNAISACFRRRREAEDAREKSEIQPEIASAGSQSSTYRHANTIWALKNVSFEVKRGEVVGIIGKNGSGKSTLLKILSRVTSPTEGYAEVYGRVGSLLEVGTGFHPELTGRENIYFNGAILGMKKAEIERKFDEIVAFSEIEKFLDTPVKRYSSGMYLRLAFAVAAHLEPEILIVDEVLAVGDAQFQKKCLGKMGEVAKGGRTVLFVSHNMSAIRELCSRALLLNSGRVVFEGSSTETIAKYLMNQGPTPEAGARSGAGAFIVREFFKGVEHTPLGITLLTDTAFICGLEIHVEHVPDQLWINLEIYSADGVPLVHIRNDFDGIELPVRPGNTTVEVKLEDLPLLPDSYSLRFRLVCDYGGTIVTDDSRDYPLLVPGVKGKQMKYQAFVRARHTWKVTQDA